MRFKAVVVGSYGEGNIGDDALMLANVNLLKRYYRSDEIAVVAKKEKYIEKLLNNIQVYDKYDCCKINTSLLLYGGGTQFYSFGRESKISKIIKTVRDFKKTNYFLRKIVFNQRYIDFSASAALGIGIGPFVNDDKSEKCSRRLINSLDFVAVRDGESLNFCKKWGSNQASLGADLCYLPELWSHVPLISRATANPPSVGMIVRDWPHTDAGSAYVGPLIAVARKLVDKGIGVKFILLSNKSDVKWKQILSGSGFDYVAWNPEEQKIDDFLDIILKQTVIVTSRYHGALFAGVAGIPVIFVAVEPKLSIAAAAFGQDNLWRSPFIPSELDEIISDTLSKHEKFVDRQTMMIAEQKRLAVKMVGNFKTFIEGL